MLKKYLVKFKFIVIAGVLVAPPAICPAQSLAACHDINIVFARGSGETLGDSNFQEFKSDLESRLAGRDYDFHELGSASQNGYRYPAVDSGSIAVGLGALISGGRSYAFGDSVNQGVGELTNYFNQTLTRCPNSQFVLAGYSQGGMVISQAIRKLDATHVIYAATLGDPKLYLPEGAKVCLDPSAASDYRIYVPDCHVSEGILTGLRPYRPGSSWAGKLGVWCNYHDVMCSSKINWQDIIGAHTAYVGDGHYAELADLIAAKVANFYDGSDIATRIKSTHDLAILIDSSAVTPAVLEEFVDSAIRLAKTTLANDGRVALYNIGVDKTRQELCSFTSCSYEQFIDKIKSITPTIGTPAIFDAMLFSMNQLSWTVGASKNIVTFTNNDLTLGGISRSELVNRSLEIDPVHINIVASADIIANNLDYLDIADETNGLTTDDVALLVERFATLTPEGTIFDYGQADEEVSLALTYAESEGVLHLSLDTDAQQVLVIINDYIYGFTSAKELDIIELDLSVDNEIVMVAFSSAGYRGQSQIVQLTGERGEAGGAGAEGADGETEANDEGLSADGTSSVDSVTDGGTDSAEAGFQSTPFPKVPKCGIIEGQGS